MKNILLLIVLVFSVFVLAAQTKESLYTTMASELCKEIKEKHTELKASEDIQMDLGFMMMPVFLKHETELRKYLPNLDITDQKQMEMLGMEVGKKLVSCPEFLSLISSNRDLVKSSKDEVVQLTLQGTLAAITPGEFTSINVKTSSGKTEKIWWMEYFPGEEKLTGGSLLNKSVTLSYTEKEIYNAALKDYIKIKVAAGIE